MLTARFVPPRYLGLIMVFDQGQGITRSRTAARAIWFIPRVAAADHVKRPARRTLGRRGTGSCPGVPFHREWFLIHSWGRFTDMSGC
jgi:hypothetical protein